MLTRTSSLVFIGVREQWDWLQDLRTVLYVCGKLSYLGLQSNYLLVWWLNCNTTVKYLVLPSRCKYNSFRGLQSIFRQNNKVFINLGMRNWWLRVRNQERFLYGIWIPIKWFINWLVGYDFEVTNVTSKEYNIPSLSLGHEGEITDLEFSCAAERLISCSLDRSFRVFDLTTGSEVYCRVLDQELK